MRRIGNGVASTVIARFRYKRPEAYPIYLHAGSNIIYLNVLGQSIIVIDKYETAVELLDKRSGSYSSRFVKPSFSRERQG
jgi:hypothetical protein